MDPTYLSAGASPTWFSIGTMGPVADGATFLGLVAAEQPESSIKQAGSPALVVQQPKAALLDCRGSEKRCVALVRARTSPSSHRVHETRARPSSWRLAVHYYYSTSLVSQTDVHCQRACQTPKLVNQRFQLSL